MLGRPVATVIFCMDQTPQAEARATFDPKCFEKSL